MVENGVVRVPKETMEPHRESSPFPLKRYHRRAIVGEYQIHGVGQTHGEISEYPLAVGLYFLGRVGAATILLFLCHASLRGQIQIELLPTGTCHNSTFKLTFYEVKGKLKWTGHFLLCYYVLKLDDLDCLCINFG